MNKVTQQTLSLGEKSFKAEVIILILDFEKQEFWRKCLYI